MKPWLMRNIIISFKIAHRLKPNPFSLFLILSSYSPPLQLSRALFCISLTFCLFFMSYLFFFFAIWLRYEIWLPFEIFCCHLIIFVAIEWCCWDLVIVIFIWFFWLHFWNFIVNCHQKCQFLLLMRPVTVSIFRQLPIAVVVGVETATITVNA